MRVFLSRNVSLSFSVDFFLCPVVSKPVPSYRKGGGSSLLPFAAKQVLCAS